MSNNKQFVNRTFTALFPAPKGFKEGTQWSKPLTQEQIDTFNDIAAGLQPGMRILLRKSAKQTSMGNDFFFLEAMPAFEGKQPSGGRPQPASDEV